MAISSSSQNFNCTKCRSNANTIYVGEKPNSVSFSGCGFLGMYHIGVASCLKMHAPNWVRNIDRVYGCSVGSLVGALLLSDVCFGEACQRMMNIVKDLRSRYLGPFSPGFKLNEMLLRDIQQELPENAHIRATGKLYISLTQFPEGQNVIVSDYQTRDELVQVLLCSCFVPFYSGIFPPTYRGVRYVDGGLSNNLPTYHDTITVSPWSGNTDICPRNDGAENLVDLNFVNTSIQITASNIYRMSRMFYPPKPEVLRDFCCQGFRETVQYLRDHALFETSHPLKKNLSFSSLLHKTEERRKITRHLSCSVQCLHDQSESSAQFNDEESLEKCLKEEEKENNDVLMPLNVAKSAERQVLTVVQVYPAAVDDKTIRLEFQLPSVMRDALDATLVGKDYTRTTSVFKILSASRFRVVQVPLAKTYSVACFILRSVAILPSELALLAKRLRFQLAQLHTYFKCTGQELFGKLRNVNVQIRKDIALLLQQITVTVQIVLKVMFQRSLPLHTALLMLLSPNSSSNSMDTNYTVEVV